MSSKKQNREKDICVEFEELLTSDSCVVLVTEFLKYILYQKQQIPFTCDSLTLLQVKVKPNDRNHISIKTLLSSVQIVSEQLSSQFVLENCKIKEIVIIIGATVISPKVCIRLELPPAVLNSKKGLLKQCPRKPLLKLMRSMMECSDFQEAMSNPLGPTNTFILLSKNDSNNASEFFLPKPHYNLPPHASTRFRIVLKYNNEVNAQHDSSNLFRLYKDISTESVDEEHEWGKIYFKENNFDIASLSHIVVY
ncbi:MAD2L1-binding protein-like isoform X3 [Prorops nasuta]|uniref:MAD2L1-binding protein-like isoform X3 n=1 Tax=Prorops nasuta TaxID=863751 RepID=UPI0034CD76AD